MDKAFDWKEGDDMSLRLEPEDLRAKWEEHFAKLPVVHFQDTGCSRCGAAVVAPMRDLHATWHKNVTFQMWLTGEWAREMVNPSIGRITATFEALGGARWFEALGGARWEEWKALNDGD